MYCSGDPDRSRSIKTDFSVDVLPPLPRRLHNGANRRYLYQSRIRLTEGQLNEIIEKSAQGFSLREIGREYGVSHEAVRSVLKAAESTPSQKHSQT